MIKRAIAVLVMSFTFSMALFGGVALRGEQVSASVSTCINCYTGAGPPAHPWVYVGKYYYKIGSLVIECLQYYHPYEGKYESVCTVKANTKTNMGLPWMWYW